MNKVLIPRQITPSQAEAEQIQREQTFSQILAEVVRDDRLRALDNPDFGTDREPVIVLRRVGPYANRHNAWKSGKVANDRYGEANEGRFRWYSEVAFGKDDNRGFLLIGFIPKWAPGYEQGGGVVPE